MPAIESLQQSAKCIHCGVQLTSPNRCTYVDEEFACYLWVCPKCGSEFESSICLYQDPSMMPESVEMSLSSVA
jgi:transcription elongation factor Elf1